MKRYRTPDEILSQIESTIHQYVETFQDTLSEDERIIIEKIKEFKVNIEAHLMDIFQNSISDSELEELIDFTLHPVIDIMTKQARADGIITPNEERILGFMTKNLFQSI